MTQNLLSMIDRSIEDEFVMHVARRLGEADAATRLAINGLVSVLIGCMAQRAAPASHDRQRANRYHDLQHARQVVYLYVRPVAMGGGCRPHTVRYGVRRF